MKASVLFMAFARDPITRASAVHPITEYRARVREDAFHGAVSAHLYDRHPHVLHERLLS